MNVRGYSVGAIDARGAFTSDIDLAGYVTPGLLSTAVEADRPSVVGLPGMRHKYLPMRHDPATGLLSSGGRYLLRTYDDALGLRDHLESITMPGESTTFWNRPMFINAVRFAWRVAGAHDLVTLPAHDRNRFERYAVSGAGIEAQLPAIFPSMLESARRLGLAHVSLMYQPEQRLVGVVTAASTVGSGPRNFETLRHSLDAMTARGSVSEEPLGRLGAQKVFDRASLNITIYLPLSEQAGGAPAVWPNSPPLPLPGVERPPR